MIELVAIVDDDDIFQFTTKVKLEKMGLAKDVKIFNDGEEIFDYLEAASLNDVPNVLLLDINMPIVDGWDFLDLYANLASDKQNKISIYMISSSINPVDVEKAKKHEHIIDYITKPIKESDMLRIFK